MTDYERISRAISFIAARITEQPSLEDIAEHVHLSPFYFQRLFQRWAGTTPKRFLKILTVEHGKRLLGETRSLLDVTHDLGLSSGARLHDHFVTLEAVTPGEYKQRGRGIEITYGFHLTPFGEMLIAATARGVCRAAFIDEAGRSNALEALRAEWPLASLREAAHDNAWIVGAMFGRNPRAAGAAQLPLHVRGTNFQVAVWKALLEIPPGRAITYSRLAAVLGRPGASRAVGNAVGANPVAVLIPCHRVIRQSGAIGGYRWGNTRKTLLQAWEKVGASAETS